MKVLSVLNRFYVSDMDAAIEFYEILAGSEESLKPFVDTKATFLVDSAAEFREFLLNSGAVVIRDIKEVPTGYNMTVKHFDGTIVEYVEHTAAC